MRNRGCLTSSRYTMTFDLYALSVTQDANSGAVERTWSIATVGGTPQEGLSCSARNASPNAIGASSEVFSELYSSSDFISVTMSTDVAITKRHRITNIKDADGNFVWKDDNSSPMMFDVQGIVPIIDPFGKHVENKVLAQKAAAV